MLGEVMELNTVFNGEACSKFSTFCWRSLSFLLPMTTYAGFLHSYQKRTLLKRMQYLFSAQDLIILILKYCIDQVCLLLLLELAKISEGAELLIGCEINLSCHIWLGRKANAHYALFHAIRHLQNCFHRIWKCSHFPPFPSHSSYF